MAPKKGKGVDHSSIIDHTAEDDHALISPLSSSKIVLKNPFVVAGFPDNSMVGSICINHLIEQLHLHQIAFVDSQYIMASALFIGRKLRHPFRIYANDQGNVCALICEVPILARGIRSIVNTIVDWLVQFNASDLTVMGGILPTNVSPSFIKSRSALVLQDEDNAGAESVAEQKPVDEKQGKVVVPTTAFVVGIGGALLASCAANKIKCRGMFIPSVGAAPDPGGAAILLEALSDIVPNLKTDTKPLKAEAEMIRRQLEELLKMQQKAMEEYEQPTVRPETERIYK